MGTDKTIHKRSIKDFLAVLRKYNISSDSEPRDIRLALEELGPTYVKLGQLMANRPDVLPSELCEELSNLRDEVEPMSAEEVAVKIQRFGAAEEMEADIAFMKRLVKRIPIVSRIMKKT